MPGGLLAALRLWLRVAIVIALGQWLAASWGSVAVLLSFALALATVAADGGWRAALAPAAALPWGLATGFVGAPACVALARGAGLSLGLALPGPQATPDPLLLVSAGLLAPLFEEPLYRDRLLRPLCRQLGAPAGVLASSALFALTHPWSWGLLGTGLFGLLLGGLAVRGVSVAFCVGAHTGANLAVLSAVVVPALSPLAWMPPVVSAALAAGALRLSGPGCRAGARRSGPATRRSGILSDRIAAPKECIMSQAPILLDEQDPGPLDLISPEKYEREGYPHAEWAWLRKHDPVRRFEVESGEYEPFWAVTKHADIVDIGKRPKDWIIEPRIAVFAREAPEEPVARHLLTMDPPDHGRYRNLISKWFTPRTVKVWEPKVQGITREVLDAAAAKGEIDFVADVSAPITIAVIALMLGVPEEDWHLLFRWTNEIIAPEDPEFQRGRTTEETSDTARLELFTYFKELAERRRADPRDDILSVVVQGRIDGEPLPDFELLSYYFLLVVAGNETTRNAMTGGIQCFLDNPEQWQALVDDPGLVEGAIEETVRWTTPVNQFARTATRDMELRGKQIRQGESVCLFYASGNRDEEVFEEPFRFRIDRWPNDHVGFGRGEHVCLGAHLARLEIRSMYQQLRERLVSMERTGDPVRARSSFVGGVKRAPMRWTLR